MADERIRSFKEFWPFYVGEHTDKTNRTLHFIGTTGAFASVATAVLTGKKRWLLAAPVCGYAFAWFGHFVIEKNKPATFTYPLWSAAADFVMWGKTLVGTMDDEVVRCAEELRERDEQETPDVSTPEEPAPTVSSGSNGAGGYVN